MADPFASLGAPLGKPTDPFVAAKPAPARPVNQDPFSSFTSQKKDDPFADVFSSSQPPAQTQPKTGWDDDDFLSKPDAFGSQPAMPQATFAPPAFKPAQKPQSSDPFSSLKIEGDPFAPVSSKAPQASTDDFFS